MEGTRPLRPPGVELLPPWREEEIEGPAGLSGRTRAKWAHLILGFQLVVAGLFLVEGLVTGLALWLWPESEIAREVKAGFTGGSPSGIFLLVLLTFVLFGALTLLWLALTRRRPLAGLLQYLQLRRFWRSVLPGIGVGVGLVVALLIGATLWALATEGPDALQESGDGEGGSNPQVELILRNLTWPLAIFIALAAGIGEEVFFRGAVQRWIGVWPQAVLFGLVHAGGGQPLQVLVTFAIGLLFGFLVRRGVSLWTVIVAHAVYDMVLLSLALLWPEAAGG